MSRASEMPAPMPMAELAECCGAFRVGIAFGDHEEDVDEYCENCPLLIGRRRERVLQMARAS